MFYFHFFNLKFPNYEKLAMTSQFDLTRFYDVIICNSVFRLGFLTWEFQIPVWESPKYVFEKILLTHGL